MAGVDLGGGKKNETFSINLYPMLDIFSILICFLLMNFSTEGDSSTNTQNLELPKSEVRLTIDSSVNVSITRREIIIQGGSAIPLLPGGDIPPDEVLQGDGIRSLYEAFKRIKSNNDTIKNRNQTLQLSESDLNMMIMEADKDTPFVLLRKVFKTAVQADLPVWKLAVDKNAVE